MTASPADAGPALPGGSDRDRARTATILLGLVLTLGLAWLHLEYQRGAGALWRDEVNSLNVASMSSLGAVLAHAHLDSFPLAWVSALHAWIAAGLGETDAAVRQIGLIVGLATVGALWWAGRRLQVAAPLVTLLILGMSPSVIVYGDQVRGYGLGILTIVWAFGAFWTVATRPTVGRVIGAQAAAVAAAQSYYANAFLLLAIGAGAAAVCAHRRAWRRVATIGILGIVAAASLGANWKGITYAARVSRIELENPGLAWRLEVFRHGLAPDVPVLAFAWAAVAALALVGSVLALLPGAPTARHDDVRNVDRGLFALVTATTAVGAFVWYLQYLARVPTQYWYYLSLMAVLALACELGVDALVRALPRAAWLRVAAVALLALLSAPAVARNVPLRMTNVDLLARQVTALAQPDDLVVVLPWYCGISFARYYDGPAPWMTLPDFEDHRFHVHEQVKDRMTRGDAGIADELDRIERTLRAGARVWIVGAPLPPPNGEPVTLAPAPHGPDGWHVGPYLEGWAMQLGALLDTHADKVGRIEMPKLPMNRWEHLPLFGAEGWR